MQLPWQTQNRRAFDAAVTFLQSPRPMPIKTICTGFCLALVCLFAPQLHAQPALNTNRPTVFSTNRTVRSLSLDECIRMALRHNFRLQILRHDPIIERYQLAAEYGLYDPVFNVRYTKRESSSEGRFNEITGTQSNPNSTESDTVSPSLSGVLPTGLTYDLGADFARNRGINDGESFGNYVANVNVQLEQPLLRDFWTDANRTQIQIRKKDLNISELELEEEIRLVTRDVQAVYYELMFAREEIKVQEKALELAHALVADNNEKVRVGVMVALDAKQAEATAATALADLIAAESRAYTTENALKNLITDKFQDWLNIAIEPAEKLVAIPETLNTTESWATALIKRADLKRLHVEAEIVALERRLRKNQLFPVLNAFGSYGRNGVDNSAPQQVFLDTNTFLLVTNPAHRASFGSALRDISDNLSPRHTYGVLFRIPLSRRYERNRYSAIKEEGRQIETTIRQLHQTILHDVDTAIAAARAAYERVGATHQARLFAELALDAAQKRLAAGTGIQFQVLELQRDLTTARFEEIRSLTDYNRAMIEVFFRDGTILDRNKINVKYK